MMWGLSSIFYFVLTVISILIILFLTLVSKNKKLFKYEIIVFVTVIILSILYFFNHDFQIGVKSYLFPQEEHTVFYNDERLKLKLPENSVWLFKVPDAVYYSKNDVEHCKKFFDNNLKKLQNDEEISDYTYNSEQNYYMVTIKPKYSFEISLIGNSDKRRFSITSEIRGYE